jgi:hypothetical protein
VLSVKGFSLARNKGRATSLTLKVITCEELAHFLPITFYAPFIFARVPIHANKIHSLAGATDKRSYLRVGEITSEGMNQYGTGIGTFFKVTVENKGLRDFGEPTNFVHNGSIEGSIGHTLRFSVRTLCMWVLFRHGHKKSIPLRIGMLFLHLLVKQNTSTTKRLIVFENYF